MLPRSIEFCGHGLKPKYPQNENIYIEKYYVLYILCMTNWTANLT